MIDRFYRGIYSKIVIFVCIVHCYSPMYSMSTGYGYGSQSQDSDLEQELQTEVSADVISIIGAQNINSAVTALMNALNANQNTIGAVGLNYWNTVNQFLAHYIIDTEQMISLTEEYLVGQMNIGQYKPFNNFFKQFLQAYIDTFVAANEARRALELVLFNNHLNYQSGVTINTTESLSSLLGGVVTNNVALINDVVNDLFQAIQSSSNVKPALLMSFQNLYNALSILQQMTSALAQTQET